METEIPNQEASFPSARYFQVHFEYLEDLLAETKQRLDALKQVITDAQQSELPALHHLNEHSKQSTSINISNRGN